MAAEKAENTAKTASSANRKAYKLYSPLPDLPLHKTWAEIDLSALTHNYNVLRRLLPADTRPMAVVKADAYGHGATACVKALLDEGCDFFCVSCIDEALPVREAVRNAGRHADILILGYTLPEQAEVLAANDIIQTVFSETYAESLAHAARRAGVKVRVHVKLDTGMNRLGFTVQTPVQTDAAVDEILRIARDDTLVIEGIFSHFATADADGDPDDTGAAPDGSLTQRQYERFDTTVKALEQGGLSIPCKHICNSAAAVRYPAYAADAVRLGVLLYGVNPLSGGRDLHLRPVMRLCTVVSHLHVPAAGETVSYGAAHKCSGERTLATLPIGYADGFVRAYAGACVTVCTAAGPVSVPLVGRICMDQCMADVTGLPVRIGDRVVLFGDNPAQLDALAARAHTISYESLCLVSARVPRITIADDRNTASSATIFTGKD